MVGSDRSSTFSQLPSTWRPRELSHEGKEQVEPIKSDVYEGPQFRNSLNYRHPRKVKQKLGQTLIMSWPILDFTINPPLVVKERYHGASWNQWLLIRSGVDTNVLDNAPTIATFCSRLDWYMISLVKFLDFKICLALVLGIINLLPRIQVVTVELRKLIGLN